ncbi:HPr kinase/phosphorylase [Aestuariivita boseongensis]|uniref:HPr kinase/phosphorylase n=1 Tax=Aestuariivita boseongensis TaxID=1470562 RepID=UPI000680F351|nr:hypothetical protein [Aestuariivita boseongensis]
MSAAHIRPEPDLIIHASCVALEGRAVLIRGAAGRGKSALALEMIHRRAELVADDRTCLIRRTGAVIAYAPQAILGAIEARFVGILQARIAPPSPIVLIVDLDHQETERLPQARSCDLLGQELPLLHGSAAPHFAAALMQYLSSGPWTPS